MIGIKRKISRAVASTQECDWLQMAECLGKVACDTDVSNLVSRGNTRIVYVSLLAVTCIGESGYWALGWGGYN